MRKIAWCCQPCCHSPGSANFRWFRTRTCQQPPTLGATLPNNLVESLPSSARDDCGCLRHPLLQHGHCISPRSTSTQLVRVALANAGLNRPISWAKMPDCVPWWSAHGHQGESPTKPPWFVASHRPVLCFCPTVKFGHFWALRRL